MEGVSQGSRGGGGRIEVSISKGVGNSKPIIFFRKVLMLFFTIVSYCKGQEKICIIVKLEDTIV